MKKNKFNVLLIMAILACSACSQNEVDPIDYTGNAPDLPSEKATVYFKMNTTAFKSATQTRAGQTYDAADLRILAFRQNNGNYLYIGDVDKAKINFDGKAFTGSAQLPVGNYKFIPAYGVPETADANVSFSNLDFTTPYSDNLSVDHLENGVLPAIFLQKEDVVVKDYNLGIDSKEKNTTVALELTRAVARLDIQFVQGEKNNGQYEEVAGPVFGTKTDLAQLTLNFEGLNPSVQFTNGKLVGTGITPINALFNVDLTTARTDGNAAATIYGKAKGETPYDYEAVAQEDFINGSTHIYGPFLFPFADAATEGSNLTLTLTSTPDNETQQVYTRTIHIDNVPLSRNKVTLIKIYSGGDDIFHTNTAFEITVNKAWEDHQEISGSVE